MKNASVPSLQFILLIYLNAASAHLSSLLSAESHSSARSELLSKYCSAPSVRNITHISQKNRNNRDFQVEVIVILSHLKFQMHIKYMVWLPKEAYLCAKITHFCQFSSFLIFHTNWQSISRNYLRNVSKFVETLKFTYTKLFFIDLLFMERSHFSFFSVFLLVYRFLLKIQFSVRNSAENICMQLTLL